MQKSTLENELLTKSYYCMTYYGIINCSWPVPSIKNYGFRAGTKMQFKFTNSLTYLVLVLCRTQFVGSEFGNFWRVRESSEFSFVLRTWVWKGSKFSFSRFGSGFGPFLAKQVWSSGFLEGFERVRCSVLVEESGFEYLSSKFDLSSSKRFEVRYIWPFDRSNTSFNIAL